MTKGFSARPAWQRGAIVGGWLLVTAIVLVQCSGGREADDDAFTEELRTMSAPGTYAGTVSGDATKAGLVAAARKKCEGKTQCMVLGWPEGVPVATAWPLLPRESETVAFSYRLNRGTGFEQALYDCQYFPGAAEECLSDAEPVE